MSKAKDLTGKKFGKLIIQQPTKDRAPSGSVLWKCICDCGNFCIISTNSLTTGHTKSCGRCPRVKDLTGFKNGRLTVLEITNKKSGNDAIWKCVCECGNTTNVSGNHLKRKIDSTKSCGCLTKETARELMTKHGMHTTKTYRSWVSMIERCYNPKAAGYDYYGGSGIFVCDQWLNSFENFYADMGDRPKDMTLDRKDSNGNYVPNNCKWSTIYEQANNRRNNVIINYNGINYTRGQLAEKFNIPTSILGSRLRHGWLLEDAINTPFKKKKM